ncbi:hypothetical protein PP501_gp60 [Gordonia phage Powerball]|uniref:DUF7352 domain-containing protein n=1 Tax=Gordonia phage Powerball TaxID=2599847 RepID=A0A5J6TYN2_9CAUD|nr:hypothetical protein PP501_gp60 [Gordonia phage Powerball]QFG13492.1 hypothetical protein PBI_POWERBALL_60 [Gordonia phage Powerball]
MSEPVLAIHRQTVPITDMYSFNTTGFVRRILKADNVRTTALMDTALDVWFETYDNDRPCRVIIHVVGTGNPMPRGRIGDHIDSVITPSGLVWHVYGRIVDLADLAEDDL